MQTNLSKKLPIGIWGLGFVSLLMDVSSELVHSLLPLYMASVLGASMLTIGLIEGIAEATAAITKVFSGVISDAIGKRKPLLIFGYGLATLSKPIFPLAGSIGWVFTARFMDRLGKGVRVAPRDALVADITPEHMRGAAYGLRQALDSVGAFIGPLLAVIGLLWLADDIRSVLWIAVIPAVLAVTVLIVVVREPKADSTVHSVRAPFKFSDVKQLTRRYWWVAALGAVFTLARFSEAFLVLRAESLQLSLAYIPLVMVAMNIAYALIAYPAGKLSDRLSARSLLMFGLVILVLAYMVLAIANNIWLVFLGAILWGVHMGLTQGLLNKLVADAAPQSLRGTAFGVFNLVSGVALLFASMIAGLLWQQLGASATFIGGGVFAMITLMGMGVYSFRGGKKR
ncbi:MAG: MFS transporter [Gammaproteobacteria bacterium]|nr:MFS transporter [Gammaproteobacteria bacterium]